MKTIDVESLYERKESQINKVPKEKEREPEDNLPEIPFTPKKWSNYVTEDEPIERKTIKNTLGKTAIWTIILIAIAFLFFLIINFFWLNISISSGKFAGNDTINNQVNVDSPDVPLTLYNNNTNQHTINIENNIKLENGTIERIIDEVSDRILGELNVSG